MEAEDIPFGIRRCRVARALGLRDDGPRAAAWRICHVRQRGGDFALGSGQLPGDETFSKMLERLRAFVTDRQAT